MTSEPKWTPGPWHHGTMYGWGDNICITRRSASDYGPQGVIGDCPIAQVYTKAPHWENSYPFEANARLIAAAPELYEALERLTKAADRLMQNIHEFDKPTDQEFGDAVDSAIFSGTMALKKARGE